MLIGVSIQQRIIYINRESVYKDIIGLQCNSSYGSLKPSLLKNGATDLRDNGDVRFYRSAPAM